jgi:hypothetical protein
MTVAGKNLQKTVNIYRLNVFSSIKRLFNLISPPKLNIFPVIFKFSFSSVSMSIGFVLKEKKLFLLIGFEKKNAILIILLYKSYTRLIKN